MRIDKYLKVARILKRRTVSKELAEHQRIEINGKIVKPSHQVEIGDLITITYGNRQLTVKVLGIAEQKKKQEAQDLYEVISEKILENSEKNDISK